MSVEQQGRVDLKLNHQFWLVLVLGLGLGLGLGPGRQGKPIGGGSPPPAPSRRCQDHPGRKGERDLTLSAFCAGVVAEGQDPTTGL